MPVFRLAQVLAHVTSRLPRGLTSENGADAAIYAPQFLRRKTGVAKPWQKMSFRICQFFQLRILVTNTKYYMERAIQRSGRANGGRGECLTVCPYASTTGPSLLGNNHHGAVHPVHIQSFCFFVRREMTTRVRVGDRCARYRPSHEISPLVVQSTPSIRLDSSSKAFSRASIRSCSTHAARSISASHASWISRRPSGRVRYRYITSARHPNNNRNTATTAITTRPGSTCRER